MRRVAWQIAIWGGLYVAIVVTFLAVAAVSPAPRGRSFSIELGVALGIVGFVTWGLQFVTTGRFRAIAPYFGSDVILKFHRQMGLVAATAIFIHPVVLIAARPEYIEYFDPRANWMRTAALSASLLAAAALIVLSFWRVKFGLNYEWWRISHGLLAAFVLFIGLVHALQVGHYVAGFARQAFWSLGTLVAIGFLAYSRVVRPWKARRKPYRVAEVRPERGDVYSLALDADGHDGLPFKAGQFAWITLGSSPFQLQQHPFSLSSSDAHPRRLEFGIKDLGDFTSSIRDVPPGTQAFVEGPYGNFTLEPDAQGAVFIVGGIGVTPAVSILRSLRDRDRRIPCWLIYANNDWEQVAFRDELTSLERDLDLRVVHVVQQAPEDWTGETGYVTAEVIDRGLSEMRLRDVDYFLCGPGPLMDIAEKALRERGVPPWRVQSERFDIV